MKNILVSYDYFFPGFKAGGPIQSLVNLVQLLQQEYNVFVFTGAFDLNESLPYNNIKIDEWNTVYLPGNNTPIKVWYADTNKLNYSKVKLIVYDIKPDRIYINSMYSQLFMIYPLFAAKNLSLHTEVIICPRGMLQNGALQVKAFKKNIFLKVLKYSGLLNKASWHATNEEEKNDILNHFPKNKGIEIASNIPKLPLKQMVGSNKETGKLRLVYLSLISEKKNLHLLLKVLSLTNKAVTLDIYGPLKDKKYWDSECLPLIIKLKDRISYKGDVLPINVQNTLLQYDALILLTKGENFGHALYESLSVGRPIITSNFTPWNQLTLHKAGWNVDINHLDEMKTLIDEIAEIDQEKFGEYCLGAFNVANNYYNNQNFVASYKKCFKYI